MGKAEASILKVQLISACLIGSVMAFEISAGLLTNSLAILGDGFHALYDFLISIMLFLTYKISLKPADESHTYGHSRIKTLGAFTSGLAFLYFVIQLLLRSLDRFMNPSFIYLGSIGFLALAYTLSVDVTRIAILSRASDQGETNVKAGLLHSLADFFDTIVALMGFLLAGYFNIMQADAAAGLLLSAAMAYLGAKLLYETGLELTDAVPPIMVRRIRGIVEREYGTDGVSYLNVRRIDKNTYVDVGVFVPRDRSISDIHRSVKDVEDRIAKSVGGEVISRVQVMPRDSESLYGSIRDSALSVEGVLNVHDILVSEADGRLLISVHIEVPEEMDLSNAHKVADEVEEHVLKDVESVESVMVHVETAGSTIMPIKAVELNSSSYFKVKEIVENEIKRFHDVKGARKITVFKEASGLNRIELNVVMEGDKSIGEAHGIASRLEDGVKQAFGGNVEVVIHVEPETNLS
ncbi:MAG: cation-efflux pump [Thermoproteota archaeon]